MENNRIRSMDFIRAISVVMIIVFHFYVEAKSKGFTSKFDFILSNLGDFGVSFFIMISGGGLYISTKKGFSLISFYKKRAITIYPSFYIAYLAVSFFLYITMNRIVFKEDPLLMLFTLSGIDGFMSSNFKTYYLVGEWFLGFIIFIYLIYPILLKLFNCSKWGTFAASVAISILCFKFSNTIYEHFIIWNKTDTWNPLVRLPEFIFGMIFFGFMLKNKKHSSIIAFISLATIIFYSCNGLDMTDYYKTPLFIATLVITSIFYERVIKYNTLDEICLSLSALSFMAFLLHHQIIYALSRNGIMKNMSEYNLFYGFSMTLIICFACAHLLNKSVNKIKNRFTLKRGENL